MTSSERTEPGAHSEVLGATGQQIVVGHRTGVDRRSPLRRCLCGADQFDGIWQQCALVGDHLKLDPVGAQRLAGQLRGEHSIGGAARARGAGSGVLPSRLSRSSTPVPPTASTRRIATVISSVPDATSASSSAA